MSFQPVLQVLPLSIREVIRSLPAPVLECLEEVRVRQERPLEIVTNEESWFVSRSSRLSKQPHDAMIPNKEDCLNLLNLISNHSLYTMDEELRQGYVTVEGGHRIGLVGKVIVEGGKVKHLRDITGFNVRIARQVPGVADPLLPYMFHHKKAENVLIVSPPQCGKTTLIRDLARRASEGSTLFPAFKVGIVDERSEIAGCVAGIPQHDVGPRTDVLDGCPKAEGMMMMIRSMSPDILVVDEIGRKADSDAIHEAIYAGVHIFATVHGQSIKEIAARPVLKELLQEKVFTRIVLLSRRKGPGTVEGVFNQFFERLDTRQRAGRPGTLC